MRQRLVGAGLRAYRTWRLWIEPERVKMKRDVAAWVTASDPRSVVVEVGAGTEFMRPVLEARMPGLRYFGGDISPTTNTHAVFDVCAIPLPTACADVVMALEVLEHIPTPDQAVAEMSRILRPGGRMVLTVPFMFGVHDFRDYQRFTPLGMEQLARRNGLSVVEVRGRGGTFVASTGLVRHLILTSIVGRPRDWRAQGRAKKVRWILATIVLTPWTPISWLAFLLDMVLDRDSGNPPGFFFLLARDEQVDPRSSVGTTPTGADWARRLLRCPGDGSEVRDDHDEAGLPVLACPSCGRRYRVEDDVPILLLSDAREAPAG